MIPGLDTAIIPKPLEGVAPKKADGKSDEKPGTPAADIPPPIDDPDGVLENH